MKKIIFSIHPTSLASSIALGISIFFTLSCSSIPESNKAFEKQYGDEIKQIKKERLAPKGEQESVFNSNPPSQAEIDSANPRFAAEVNSYVEVNQFGNVVQRETLPNAQSFEMGQAAFASGALPPDMFCVTYNTDIYPGFYKSGEEFDEIKIPSEDAYGIGGTMSAKTYTLVGNSALQKNIDLVNADRTKRDIKISNILITELRDMNRKKRLMKELNNDEELAKKLQEPEEKKEKSNLAANITKITNNVKVTLKKVVSSNAE